MEFEAAGLRLDVAEAQSLGIIIGSVITLHANDAEMQTASALCNQINETLWDCDGFPKAETILIGSDQLDVVQRASELALENLQFVVDSSYVDCDSPYPRAWRTGILRGLTLTAEISEGLSKRGQL